MLVKMRGSNGETVAFGDKTVRMVSQVSVKRIGSSFRVATPYIDLRLDTLVFSNDTVDLVHTHHKHSSHMHTNTSSTHDSQTYAHTFTPPHTNPHTAW